MSGAAAYVRRWDRSAPAPDRNRSAGDRPGPGTGAPQTAERLPAASRSGRDPGARRGFRTAPPSGQLRLPGQAPFFLRTQCAGSGRRLILTATGGTAPRTVPGSPVRPLCFRPAAESRPDPRRLRTGALRRSYRSWGRQALRQIPAGLWSRPDEPAADAQIRRPPTPAGSGPTDARPLRQRRGPAERKRERPDTRPLPHDFPPGSRAVRPAAPRRR